MANRGVKKKKTKYNDSIRVRNAHRRLEKHLKNHPGDSHASRAKKALSS